MTHPTQSEIEKALEYFKENNPSVFNDDAMCSRIAHAQHLRILIRSARTATKSEQYVQVLMGLLDVKDDVVKKMRLALEFYAEDDDHGQKARDTLSELNLN